MSFQLEEDYLTDPFLHDPFFRCVFDDHRQMLVCIEELFDDVCNLPSARYPMVSFPDENRPRRHRSARWRGAEQGFRFREVAPQAPSHGGVNIPITVKGGSPAVASEIPEAATTAAMSMEEDQEQEVQEEDANEVDDEEEDTEEEVAAKLSEISCIIVKDVSSEPPNAAAPLAPTAVTEEL
eukprot:TRINITY_DN2292_c0_g1_i1.p1 TRINITY_DN2292_c0_g1~~TRINITY_DN2292_c0_g1_i1.p1  ORF type:complete len:181 (+),score=62.80 TRINITY_DN2292_c0_g1_i1:64-606(+)